MSGFVRHGFKYVEKFSSDKRIQAVVGFLICVLSMLKSFQVTKENLQWLGFQYVF